MRPESAAAAAGDARPAGRAGALSHPWSVALLFLAGAAILAAGLGARHPWAPDEPRFALIARDMLAHGNWWIPEVGGDYYPDKPPLFMWAVAAASRLTGSLQTGFLLPSLLSGLGVLWLVRDLGCRLWDRETGLAAGVLLLATVQFPLQVKSAQIDMTLTLFTTLALYGLCRHLLLGPTWGWYAAGFAAAGLGVITKGVGFLPVLLFLPWAWARATGRLASPGGPRAAWLLGPAAFLAAVSVWLGPMLWQTWATPDPALAAYRDDILLRQTVERYADSWGHLRPWWYYLVEVIPTVWLPTAVALPWLLPRWRAAWRDGRVAAPMLALWILLVVLFFSASPGKRGVYLLPAVPALALAAAPWARELVSHRGVRLALAALLAVVAVAAAALAVLPVVDEIRHVPGGEERFRAMMWASAAALLALLAVFGVRRAHVGVLVALAGGWLVFSLAIYPLADELRSGRSVPRSAEAVAGPGVRLGLVRWKEQFLLHATRPLTHFGFRSWRTGDDMADAVAWLANAPDRALVMRRKDLLQCFDPALAEPLAYAHSLEWYLVREHALRPSCRTRERPAVVFDYTPPAPWPEVPGRRERSAPGARGGDQR